MLSDVQEARAEGLAAATKVLCHPKSAYAPTVEEVFNLADRFADYVEVGRP